MKYRLNQIYGPEFERKKARLQNVFILHQQHDQETGIEQKKAYKRKVERARKNRITTNVKMTEIINLAKKNLAAGNVIKVGI